MIKCNKYNKNDIINELIVNTFNFHCNMIKESPDKENFLYKKRPYDRNISINRNDGYGFSKFNIIRTL